MLLQSKVTLKYKFPILLYEEKKLSHFNIP